MKGDRFSAILSSLIGLPEFGAATHSEPGSPKTSSPKAEIRGVGGQEQTDPLEETLHPALSTALSDGEAETGTGAAIGPAGFVSEDCYCSALRSDYMCSD